MKEHYYERLFWSLALALFLFRLLHIWFTTLDLAPDEAYYWDWSRQVAAGYYSKPPMIAWIIALFTRLGGDHAFSVRLGAVILAFGTSVAIFYLGKAVFNRQVGFWAFAIGNATPGFTASSFIMTIDPPLLFFWGVTVLLVFHGITQGRSLAWYLGGLCLGLGLLSKYTMVAIIPSLFLYLGCSDKMRFWLTRKEPYLFVGIGVMCLIPNLYWIYAHHGITIQHTTGIVETSGLNLLDPLIFIGTQVGILSPLTFLMVAYGLWYGIREGFRRKDERYLFLAFQCIVLLGFFVALSFFFPCYANWAAPAYITGFVMAVAAVIATPWHDTTKRRVLVATLIVGVVTTVGTYQMDTVRSLGIGTSIPARKLPVNRLKGWRTLGLEVGRLWNQLGPHTTFIISEKRQIVGELAFYVPGNPRVYMLNITGGAASQYDLWESYQDKIGMNALYVTKITRHPPKAFTRSFDRVTRIKDVLITTGDELIRGYAIYLCRRYHGAAAP
jgi:4-amino-4-deoxy-L-arabinose transferase-like glycosyltransferase